MDDTLGSRRLVAFLIDCVAFLGLAILLLFPLARIDGDVFRIGSPLPEPFSESLVSTRNGATTATISGIWTVSNCVEPGAEPKALLDLLAPHEVRGVLVCVDSFLGLASGHTAHVDYFLSGPTQSGMQGNSKITVTKRGAPGRLSVPTDDSGNPVRALFPIGLLTFGLMLAVAALGWPTPGKLVTGLRVESVDGTCRACRELRRLGPLVIAGAFVLVAGLFSTEVAQSPVLQWGELGLQVGFWIFVIWYYAVPFMSDAGRARYDWATKFRVVLA
jgi:hypothetical protein